MQRFASLIQFIERGVLTAAVMAMAANTILNVFARNVLGRNLAASQELNEFLIIVVCFVGLSYAASQGRHIRMTALYDQFSPRSRRYLMILVSATTGALLFYLAWYGWQYAWNVDRISPVLRIPVKFVYLLVPLGLFLGGVQYFLTLARNLGSERAFLSFDHPDETLDGGPEKEG